MTNYSLVPSLILLAKIVISLEKFKYQPVNNL